MPLKLGRETYILLGGQHASVGLGFYKDRWYSEIFRITDFKTGIFFPWQNDNHKTLVLSFTRWGEQEGDFLESDNFQIGGIALHSYQVNDRLALKAGLYYNHEFFGHYFVPLAGIDWRIKDDLWLYGTLPANLQLHKQLSRSFGLSASYLSLGGSMQFNEEPGYLRVGQGFPPYGILGIDFHLTVLGPATLKASIGHSISRNYGMYSVEEVKEVTGPYADYKDGLVFRMSLIARVYEKTEE
jgi:hypothetical protein